MKCAVCENETSGGHTCPGCHRYVHIPCGRCSGEEGLGSNVWCVTCDLSKQHKIAETQNKGIKRKQEQLHHRMLKSSINKFPPANIGDTVLIPIAPPDVMTKLG